MTRETKLNLVFLIAFLAVSLPGAAILFIKKLDPNERRMSAPPFVRTTAAYNNPMPTRSDTVRIAPSKTLAWVSAIAGDRLGAPPLRASAAGGRLEPVVSNGRHFELLDIAPADDGLNIVLLAWLDAFGDEQVQQLDGRVTLEGGEEVKVGKVEIESLAVPPDVVAELKNEGYVVPPARVAIVRLWTPMTSGGEPRIFQVALEWQTAIGRRSDVLEVGNALLKRSPGGKADVTAPAQNRNSLEGNGS